MLKLTGCKEDEFTCDDGQCVKTERRCDQVTGKESNCRDRSDEKGCKLIVLKDEEGFNKNIPPIESRPDGSVIPARVSISITLMNVVEIEEVDHSIHLQFQITLMWMENRVRYQNLKNNVLERSHNGRYIKNLVPAHSLRKHRPEGSHTNRHGMGVGNRCDSDKRGQLHKVRY